MPIYVYECTRCEREFEVIQQYVSDEDCDCIFCGARSKKIPTVFNGKGWDYWRLMDDLKDGKYD